jgi:hypothetical protein
MKKRKAERRLTQGWLDAAGRLHFYVINFFVRTPSPRASMDSNPLSRCRSSTS